MDNLSSFEVLEPSLKWYASQLSFEIRVLGSDLQTKNIYQLLKITLSNQDQYEVLEGSRLDQERKTSGNVRYVSHGIMTHKITLRKIRKIFS